MEARTILQKIRQKGFTIKAVGNAISLAPKKFLNDEMINFIREHKEPLLSELYTEQYEHIILHNNYKKRLSHRVQVLRVLIRNKLNKNRATISESYFWVDIEKYLDATLIKHAYDLEVAIHSQQDLSLDKKFDHFDVCIKCKYIAIFCECKDSAFRMICSMCQHFTPDSIGDGAGVGTCEYGIVWTRKLNERIPLYRYADRDCDKFIKSTY